MNHPFFMVYTTQLRSLGGWLVVAIPTLYDYENGATPPLITYHPRVMTMSLYASGGPPFSKNRSRDGEFQIAMSKGKWSTCGSRAVPKSRMPLRKSKSQYQKVGHGSRGPHRPEMTRNFFIRVYGRDDASPHGSIPATSN